MELFLLILVSEKGLLRCVENANILVLGGVFREQICFLMSWVACWISSIPIEH
jgi:hypothetical protein